MPDPLGITGSIIAVLQLTASIIEYLKAVHDAHKDRIKFLSEVSVLHHLLAVLQNRVEKANDSNDPWFAQVRELGVERGPLDRLKSHLEHLESKLKPASGLRAVGRSLTWKFDKADIESIISSIERTKMLVSLALTDDLS